MATPERATETTARPAGVEGDGMEAYPTYRDGATIPHQATGTKPTDVNLPRSRRTYALPVLIGLLVFAAVIVIRIVWGSVNMASTADDALTPGDPASPPAAAAPANAPAASTAAPLPLDDEQPDATTGPGEVEPMPGAIDVPGGETTTRAGEVPAQ